MWSQLQPFWWWTKRAQFIRGWHSLLSQGRFYQRIFLSFLYQRKGMLEEKRTGNSGVNSVMGCWIRTVGNPVFSCISEVAHEYIFSWILLKWGVLCSWILFHLVGPASKPTRLYFGLMSTLLGYHQVYSGVVRSAEGLMSPSVVLLAWTSPGPQEHHMKAAAQLDSVAVKELCFL